MKYVRFNDKSKKLLIYVVEAKELLKRFLSDMNAYHVV